MYLHLLHNYLPGILRFCSCWTAADLQRPRLLYAQILQTSFQTLLPLIWTLVTCKHVVGSAPPPAGGAGGGRMNSWGMSLPGETGCAGIVCPLAQQEVPVPLAAGQTLTQTASRCLTTVWIRSNLFRDLKWQREHGWFPALSGSSVRFHSQSDIY